MTDGRLLVGVATVAAVLGGLAFVTGEGLLAALAGLCAIAAASLATRSAGSRTTLLSRGGRQAAEQDVAAPVPAPRPRTDDGVLTEPFVQVTLENRVAVARRALRPVSIVLLEVQDAGTETDVWVMPALVTSALASTVRESDIAGRRDDGVYVFVLEDTGEDGAVWTAERMRRNLTSATGRRRFRAGIASYPTHGLDAETIMAKASAALDAAREWKRDRIEVATGA